MGVVVVVVLDPSGKRCQRSGSIRQRRDADVIALEGMNEGLRDAVGLRAADGREAGFEAQLPGKGACFASGIGRAVIGQHLDRHGRAHTAEAGFHGFQHDVAHVRAADARIGDRAPGDDLAAGLIGDPVDWVVADSGTAADGERTPARCPYWIVKSRTQATAAALEHERSTPVWRGSGPPQPVSSALSGTSLTRSYAIRQTQAPAIRRLGTFDLSSPNGEDVHAVLEELNYGSLSLRGADRTAKSGRPSTPYARPRSSQLVGR